MADFDALKEYALTSWSAQSEWREQAESDFAFLDGHQWTDSERAALEEQSRVPIVFNRVAVMIGAVAGSEINNRTEVRFIPREIGDAQPNEVLSAGAEWFRDQADAEDADSEAFTHLLVCGLGVTETTLDWEDDPEGAPHIKAVDPLEFFWDCHAREKGLTDARYLGLVRQMPASEAEERFSGKSAEEIHCGWLKTGTSQELTNIPGDEYRDGEDEGEPRKTLTVVQIQWRERERIVEYVDPATGQKAEMDASKFAAIQKRVPLAIPSRQVSRWVWRQAFLGNNEILEENQPDPAGPTLNAMTGHWDRKKRMFYGLLRAMRDPQKFANKWLSQTLHIINTNAKGGVMVEAEAVEDVQQFEDSWAAADGVTWMKTGAISSGRIQPKPSAQMPAALMSLTEFAISAVRETSGINLELLGLRDANQPGVLEYQRRQAAMTTLARFFDALRFYRKRQGRTILNFLVHHIAPTGRLVRIVKEDHAQFVPLAVADDTRKYDVIVDDAPQAPNQKEKTWGVIEAMMPMLSNAGLSMDDWADVLEYSPLPASFVEKVRQKARQMAEQPDPQQELAAKKIESEVVENLAEAQLDTARAQQIGIQSQLAPVQAAVDLRQQMMPGMPALSGPSAPAR